MDIQKIENKTLWITVMANLVFAIAGWVTYQYTGSEAMLMDGNFSFALGFATLLAIYISKHKHKKTAVFPYGQFVYEAAFVLSKGLLILGIIVMALSQNTLKIINFFQGEKITPIVMTPIYYYVGFVLVMTFALLYYFKKQNQKTNHKSSLLLVEAESAKVDGILTSVTGFAFFLLSFISIGSKIDFMIFIGDSIIVILMCLIMIQSPLKIIKDAFIELSGGTLQNKEDKILIETTIEKVISKGISYETYISKVGSGYLIVIYLNPNTETISLTSFGGIQEKLKNQLIPVFKFVEVEMVIRPK
ncbi:cation transporter [Flavicella sp.]|uniref:cation transporter n=1 Tax=Flavicella sp. TaxID=2957742 RepID=UPI00262CA3B0|nr:cation transporter [Flavicella sp.]MDG1804846.1 cation transporter [Flavicella sp.]MDG2280910.1 cation transporter [Flavicella sp.]